MQWFLFPTFLAEHIRLPLIWMHCVWGVQNKDLKILKKFAVICSPTIPSFFTQLSWLRAGMCAGLLTSWWPRSPQWSWSSQLSRSSNSSKSGWWSDEGKLWLEGCVRGRRWSREQRDDTWPSDSSSRCHHCSCHHRLVDISVTTFTLDLQYTASESKSHNSPYSCNSTQQCKQTIQYSSKKVGCEK